MSNLSRRNYWRSSNQTSVLRSLLSFQLHTKSIKVSARKNNCWFSVSFRIYSSQRSPSSILPGLSNTYPRTNNFTTFTQFNTVRCVLGNCWYKSECQRTRLRSYLSLRLFASGAPVRAIDWRVHFSPVLNLWSNFSVWAEHILFVWMICLLQCTWLNKVQP